MRRGAARIGALVVMAGMGACKHDAPPAPKARAVAKSAPPPADASADARATVKKESARDAGPPKPLDPYGRATVAPKVLCRGVAGAHVAERDLLTSFVDGNDLLAIVNRSPTGQLPPSFAPTDLVDLRDGTPKTARECEGLHCLRKEAADALAELMAEMKRRGFPGKVESAFRSYGAQCGTFLNWAKKSSFCEATEQSALPGHSQHQLGTTVDLFTEAWAKDPRGVFRAGFGCTEAGEFLQEHAWDYGFVMPYPLHPDDRHPKQSCVARWDIPVNINPKTGYRYEHWHARYVGKEAALRFKRALEESGPGTPDEITVEQWLRREKGLTGPDADLPVCDGCNCGACSTLASPGEGACDARGGALHLDAHGLPLASPAPSLTSAKPGSVRGWRGRAVTVTLEVPPNVATQSPVVGRIGAREIIGYEDRATFEALAPYPDTKARGYAPLEGAWVIGVEPVPNDTGVAWPWRAALTRPITGRIYDRADVVLPARSGTVRVDVPVPRSTSRVKVVLLEGGAPRGAPVSVTLGARSPAEP